MWYNVLALEIRPGFSLPHSNNNNNANKVTSIYSQHLYNAYYILRNFPSALLDIKCFNPCNCIMSKYYYIFQMRKLRHTQRG
jgi:hypothetical protein